MFYMFIFAILYIQFSLLFASFSFYSVYSLCSWDIIIPITFFQVYLSQIDINRDIDKNSHKMKNHFPNNVQILWK